MLGQPGSLTLSSGSATQGGTVPLNLSFVPSGSQPAGLQWTFTYSPSDITAISVSPGAAATAAGKTISCAGSGGSYICLATGINTNTIANGVVAVLTVTLASSTTGTSIGVSNTLGATLGGDAYTTSGTGGTVTVSTPSYHLLSVSCSPGSMQGGASSTCTVNFDAAAPAGGLAVSLSSNNSNLIVPQSVTVTSGLTSANFTATSLGVASDQNATVTATYNGISQTSIVSLAAPTVVSSLQCNPTTLGANASGNCTVTLSKAAGSGGAVVTVSSTGVPGLTIPGSVTVAANATTGTFPISTGAVSADQNGSLTASYNGTSQSVNINLTAATVVSSLQCNPTTLGANASSNCAVTLSKAAGASGAVVTVSSAGLAGLTIPGTVTVAANATTGSFPISTGNLSANQNGSVTASYNGTSQSVNISLSTGTGISSLQCNPATLGPNANSTCTITLAASAPAGGAMIALNTTLSGLSMPRLATVPAGSTTLTFTISTFSASSNQTGSVTATYNGSSQSAPVTLTLSTVVISSLQCSPTTLGSNASSNCTITLSAPAPDGGAAVTVTSGSFSSTSAFPSSPNSFTMPSSVTVAANATTGSFVISTGTVSVDQSGFVRALYNGSSQSVTINLATTAAAGVSSLQCNPTTLGANASSNCTVTLSKAAGASGVVVTVSSTGVPGLTIPATVTVTAGSTSGPFTVSTGAVGADQNGTLTASYNGTSQSVNISLAVATVVSSLQCSPTTLGANASGNCTVTLSKAAGSGGVSVVLSGSGLPSLTVPATVMVTAGSTTGPFTVSTGAVGADQNGTLTASYNSTSQSVNMSLAAATVVSSLQCNPTTLGPNANSNCTITLSKAVSAGGIVVALSSSGLPALTVPASVTVAAGTIGLFTVSTGPLGVDQNGTLTASYNGTSQSVNMNLAAAAVISLLQCSPTTLGANAGSNCTVTLSKAAPAGGAVVALTSVGLPGLSVPASVTVTAGSTTAPFTVSTGALSGNQNGTLTASYNSTSQSVNMSLAAATVVSSLQCNPTTLRSQSTSTCTVTLSAPANVAAMVALSSSLPNIALPRVANVAAGSTTGVFTITTFTIGSNVTGPVTATYNGSSQSVNLTLTTP